MANLVTFAKKLWKDATSGGTPITAAELNRMEGGINDCANQINKLGDSVYQARGDCYSSDLNNITKPGAYKVGSSVTSNKPTDAYGWGFLLVFISSASRYILQMYIPDGSAGKIYWRSLWEGKVGPWIVVTGSALDKTSSSDQAGPELS